MGTLQIIRELLTYIQGEGHPIFRADQQRQVRTSLDVDWVASCLFLALIIAVPAILCIETTFGVQITSFFDRLFAGMLIAGGVLLSISWILPITMFSGASIARERTLRTWDTLLTTPFTSDAILLAKVASSARRVWGFTLGSMLVGSVVAIFFAAPVIFSLAAQINQSIVLGILLMLVGAVAIVIEHEQEIALAVVVGIVIALSNQYARMGPLLALAAGLLIRLLQMALTFVVIPQSAIVTMQNVAILNTIAGSATVLAAIPAVGSLLFVALMIIGRELLVRKLFEWAVLNASGQ